MAQHSYSHGSNGEVLERSVQSLGDAFDASQLGMPVSSSLGVFWGSFRNRTIGLASDRATCDLAKSIRPSRRDLTNRWNPEKRSTPPESSRAAGSCWRAWPNATTHVKSMQSPTSTLGLSVRSYEFLTIAAADNRRLGQMFAPFILNVYDRTLSFVKALTRGLHASRKRPVGDTIRRAQNVTKLLECFNELTAEEVSPRVRVSKPRC